MSTFQVGGQFQVGDRVEFIDDYSRTLTVGVKATVTHVEDEIVFVTADNGTRGSCFCWRLKLIEPATEEQEAVPVPKEFRFFRRSDAAISNDPYETFEAALAGWKVFAQDGNEVEIIEIVSHGTYKAVLKIEEA